MSVFALALVFFYFNLPHGTSDLCVDLKCLPPSVSSVETLQQWLIIISSTPSVFQIGVHGAFVEGGRRESRDERIDCDGMLSPKLCVL